MKKRYTIKNIVSNLLMYGSCLLLVCFFSFKPLIQLLGQIENGDTEWSEELPEGDSSEDDAEDDKEAEGKWSKNQIHIFSFAFIEPIFIKVYRLQRDCFNSQYMEVPIQPPRLHTLV